MIDLHSHILHGLDDGARSWEQSLAMCRLAAADGTRLIAATPHSPASAASRQYDVGAIRAMIDELNDELQAEQIDIRVIGGTEIRYDADIVAQLRQSQLLSYGDSRSILLELPNSLDPGAIERAIFSIQTAGYQIVVAHPERLAAVQRTPNTLLPLIERGVLMQITAGALTGEQGKHLQKLSETLITHNLAQLIASDAHGLPPQRAPQLAAARARAAALVGAQQAAQLTDITPAAIVNGQPVQIAAPRRVKRTLWEHWS